MNLKKKLNKKGFTLAELLVVVAIIAVLVAISIPIFSSQLEKAKDSVSVANIRAAYAEASIAALTEADSGNATFTEKTADTPATVEVEGVVLKGTQTGWSDMIGQLPFAGTSVLTDAIGGTPGTYTLTFTFDQDGVCTLTDMDSVD